MKNFEEINRTFTVKKTKFLQRVLWLMIPLLTIFTTNVWGTTQTDQITAADLAATGSSYVDFSNVAKTSSARYAGNSAKNSSNIQLRSSNSNSGIVSTTSGGYVKSVTIDVASGSNVVQVYASNTAYASAADLYSAATQGNLIGTTTSDATINIPEDYAYVGIRSSSGALYLASVSITWGDEPVDGGSSGDDYVLVENVGDIVPGRYLIVYSNTYALNTHYGNKGTNTYGTYTDISSYYSNKKIASNATTDALAFIVKATTNGYSFQKVGENTYLGCNSTNNDGLRWDYPYTASTCEWTLGVNSIRSVAQTGRYIRWNNSSGSYRFATYTSGSQQAVQLFKQSAASACSLPTAVTKGSFNRTTQKMEIGWTGATNVDICYSKSTTKPASPQVTNTSTNPYAIDVSDYSATDKCYVWVRQNCGGGETSDWVAINVSGNAYFNLPSHTLTITPSPASSGTFSPTSGQTVVEGRTVSITADPAAGYVFSSWAVSGTNAALSSTATNPTTFTMGTANATVTATFTAKPLNSISLSPASGTVYVGQYAEFAITYNPADILTKGTTLVSTPSYVATTGTTNTTLKLTGGRAGVTITEDVTETVSIQANADNTKTASVSITVKPLPKVHFVDIVHGYAFDDVVGTIEDNVLVSNKTTPTHAEYSGTGANDCETDHTRLVGWIEKTWADANPNATHEDIIDAGTGVFIEANTAINVLTYNGNTYYAVWAKLQ